MSDPAPKKFSREFFLDYKGTAITVWASLWSGLCVVSVNDVEVARGRSYRLRQTLHFTHDGQAMRIEIQVKSVMMDRITVSLFADDQLVTKTEKSFLEMRGAAPETAREFAASLLKLVVIAGIVGFVFGFVATFVTGS